MTTVNASVSVAENETGSQHGVLRGQEHLCQCQGQLGQGLGTHLQLFLEAEKPERNLARQVEPRPSCRLMGEPGDTWA